MDLDGDGHPDVISGSWPGEIFFGCDWDGDGALDLLVGDGDGAVWFFRNSAKPCVA